MRIQLLAYQKLPAGPPGDFGGRRHKKFFGRQFFVNGSASLRRNFQESLQNVVNKYIVRFFDTTAKQMWNT